MFSDNLESQLAAFGLVQAGEGSRSHGAGIGDLHGLELGHGLPFQFSPMIPDPLPLGIPAANGGAIIPNLRPNRIPGNSHHPSRKPSPRKKMARLGISCVRGGGRGYQNGGPRFAKGFVPPFPPPGSFQNGPRRQGFAAPRLTTARP